MQGKVLAGRYRLIEKLGQGGMGSVWRAEHVGLKSLVAVKLIEPAIADSPAALARFKREAQAAAALSTVNVVQIFDYGVDQGAPFIAMELLRGESLAERLGRLGSLTPSETAVILSQVARALTRAHEQGIVHRDLKPDNVFLVRDGDDEFVKVLDFGIAKSLAESTKGSLKTQTGAMLGTPYYMSPEQASGKGRIDFTTDIWALGVVAFECLVGRRPFDGDNIGGLVLAICTEPVAAPSEVGSVPAGFDAWFARACSRDKEQRFSTAAEAIAELQALCDVGAGAERLSFAPRTAARVNPHATVPSQTLESAPDAAVEPQAPMLVTTGSPASVTVPGLQSLSPKFWTAIAAALLVFAVAFVLRRASSGGEARTASSATIAALKRTNGTPYEQAIPPPVESGPSVSVTPVTSTTDRSDEPDVTSAPRVAKGAGQARDNASPKTAAGLGLDSIPDIHLEESYDGETSKGKLTLTSNPPANVILDGRPLGRTPKLGYPASVGNHTVVFVHPERGRKGTVVRVLAGKTTRVSAKFDEAAKQNKSKDNTPQPGF